MRSIFGGCFVSDFILYNIISFFLVFLAVFCVYVFFDFLGLLFVFGAVRFLSCFFKIYFIYFFILSNFFGFFGCLFFKFWQFGTVLFCDNYFISLFLFFVLIF